MNALNNADLPAAPNRIVGSTMVDSGGFHFDLHRVWSRIYVNRWAILGLIAAAILVGIVATVLTRPIYRAEARVQVEAQSSNVLGVDTVEPTEAPQDIERFLQTQAEIVRSRRLASDVADTLGLAANNSFIVEMTGNEPEFTVTGSRLAAERKRMVVDLLQEHLSVALLPNSRIIQIRYDSPRPAISVRIVNAMAQAFIEGNITQRYEATSYARKFLRDRLAETKARLEDSERALLAYARNAGLVGPTQESAGTVSSSLNSASLSQINLALSNAQATRIVAEGEWNQAAGVPATQLPVVLANPAFQQMLEQQAKLRSDYALMTQRYHEQHPTAQQLRAQLAELTTQLNALAGNLKQGIRDKYEVALNQENELRERVSGLTQAVQSEQDRGVQYNILKREVDTNRVLYDGLLQRFKEVDASSGVTANNISIVDSGELPSSPISPNIPINILLSIFVGLVLATVYVIAKEKLEDRLRSPEDVKQKLGYPALAAIPMASDDYEALEEELATPRSDIAEAYLTLRSVLEFSSANGIPKLLAVTSGRPGEGKTTTSFALARDIARIGQRVLLIDADLRRPAVHQLFHMRNEQGLSHVLAGKKSLSEVVVKAPGEESDLSVIPAGPALVNVPDLLSGSRLPELLAAARKDYDVVVMDCPPVIGLADAIILSSQADATLMVVEAGGSTGSQVRAALQRLEAGRAKILGIVMTKLDRSRNSEAYYYSYNYNYSYGPRERSEPVG